MFTVGSPSPWFCYVTVAAALDASAEWPFGTYHVWQDYRIVGTIVVPVDSRPRFIAAL